ncbi:DUF6647 family protein [Histidinibacterium aquaticum]|uniref:DUF6647 domain-containing protein n=1 Tax=Histidinibacterium aquaticum TaxID=2613962 RepID=A0A5J5GQ95_9RHOB|nr:DUF6647 family protein [Histidinibacterium aquaticum]KAA9010529.1 hypothetical protein F3S47_04605 [Histidinibacterium aquaticum]
MFRSRIAVAFATALASFCPVLPGAETAPPEPVAAWQQADNMTTLIGSLEVWLDARAEWPRRETSPRVRLVSEWQAAARQGGSASFQRGRLRGLYDPEEAEILLVLPWDPRNAVDVSVLLHELTHHRQAPHHWYCRGAQELPAYRLQDAWLAEQGYSLDVNWAAVVLDSGCTPRDIHPE